MTKSSGSENTAVHSDTSQTWLQLKQHELWLKILCMYIQQFIIYLSSICYICNTWTSQSKFKIEQKTDLQKNFNEKEKARKTRTKYKTAIMTVQCLQTDTFLIKLPCLIT